MKETFYFLFPGFSPENYAKVNTKRQVIGEFFGSLLIFFICQAGKICRSKPSLEYFGWGLLVLSIGLLLMVAKGYKDRKRGFSYYFSVFEPFIALPAIFLLFITRYKKAA